MSQPEIPGNRSSNLINPDSDPPNTMSESESLALISQMIQTAREEHNENGLGWRVWGWILFIASLGTFFMLEYNLKGSFWFWNLALPVGVILMVITSYRKKSHKRNRTYAQDLLDRMGVGFFASVLSMVAGINFYYQVADNPGDIDFWGFFFILYAFWMYIHGSALRFKPLMVGAALNWLAGIAMFGIDEMKYEMLMGALAILLGYLVPGYLLLHQSKKKSYRNV